MSKYRHQGRRVWKMCPKCQSSRAYLGVSTHLPVSPPKMSQEYICHDCGTRWYLSTDIHKDHCWHMKQDES